MELPLLELYPLNLEIAYFACAVEHIKYVYNNTLEWHYYDKLFKKNDVLHEWNKRRKTITENSAIYAHQNYYKSELIKISNFESSIDKEFEGITTTLPVGQRLFRDTKIEDITREKSINYIPTSLIPGIYINYEYNTTLMLTIKSTGIKCHYYGEMDGFCEWEVLLTKGLMFTETKRYFISEKINLTNEICSTTNRLIIELDITN